MKEKDMTAHELVSRYFHENPSSSIEALANRCMVYPIAIRKALDGEDLWPSTQERIRNALCRKQEHTTE